MLAIKQPLLQTKIEDLINKIEREIWSSIQDEGVGVLTGLGGYALFYENLWLHSQKSEHETKFWHCIELIYEKMNQGGQHYSYCDGITGVAFLLDHYAKKGVLETVEVDETLTQLDAIILKWAQQKLNQRVGESAAQAYFQLDILHGAMGAVFYLNQRVGKLGQLEKPYQLLLKQCVEAIRDDLFKFRRKGLPSFNFGLAHGTAGHLIVLAKCLQNDPSNAYLKNTIELLLDELVKWANPNKNEPVVFPGKVADKKDIQYKTSLGWCYGDQTTTWGIYYAASVLKMNDRITIAKNWALHSAKRNTIETACKGESTDAGICHGLAGVAYLNQYWYQLSGHAEFKDNHSRFIELVCQYATYTDTISGFKKFSEEGFVSDFSFLQGAAGIGIVLLQTMNPKNTHWQEFLLL